MRTSLVLAIKSAEESSRWKWKSYPGGDNSSLTSTALVSSTPAHVNWCTEMLITKLPSSDSQLQSTDTGTPKPFETGHLTHFRKLSLRMKFQKKLENYSQLLGGKEPIRIMTQLGESRKGGTRKEMSTTSSSLNGILSLASQFHKGYCYRSQPFLQFMMIDGVEVDSHPLVSCLLKGSLIRSLLYLIKVRLGLVEKVLGCLKSLGPNRSLSLQPLVQKLHVAVLLALDTASWSMDLALIDVNFCHFVPGGIRCTLGGLTKEARSKHSRTPLEVGSFTDSLICPVMCMCQ